MISYSRGVVSVEWVFEIKSGGLCEKKVAEKGQTWDPPFCNSYSSVIEFYITYFNSVDFLDHDPSLVPSPLSLT
jgi:hypothetical protein